MKKKRLWKMTAVTVLAAAMVLGASTSALASPTIEGETGSLQIQKYKTGTTEGIEDVSFSYAQVGAFEQTDGTVSGVTIANDELETYLTEAGLKPIGETNGVYDGAAVQDALAEALKDSVTKAAIENMAATKFAPTDVDGLTNKAENLPLGLYLVAEKDAPEAVTKKADPFIVSVPILEENDGVQSWKYDVLAQPKNDYIDEKPKPEKEALDETGETAEAPSASIGDTVTFRIHSTVPAIAGELNKFVFVDTMSEGLDFKELVSVKGRAVGGNEFADLAGDAYTAANEGRTFTVDFADANTAIKGVYEEIEVIYTAVLNEKAIVGGDGNENAFKVSYTDDPKLDVEAIPVFVDTYGFTLQKNGTDSQALAGAVFQLYQEATEGSALSFYTALGQDGKPAGNSVTEVTTPESGQVGFYGLKAGDYYLEETKAPAGYNLLKTRVKITVTADTTADGTDVTIVNTKGFQLPTTGGMGTVLFTVGGLLIMGAAVLLLVRSRKVRK